jgi:uncharacterized protein
MTLEQVFAYIGAITIGLCLGIIGGGGSILTVPVMVYILHISPVLATAYSLFVVGSCSLAGSISYMYQKMVDFKVAFLFGIPSFIGVFLMRRFVIPAIPDKLFQFSNEIIITKDIAIMILFAVIMILSAVAMIRQEARNKMKEKSENEPRQRGYFAIILDGFVVGGVTGAVGAGGGFLIIPALVFFARLPMRKAVGTSLLIIAVKSLLGFLGDVGQTEMDYEFLLGFTIFAILGILLGSYVSKFISNERLKKAFGWFIVAMGVFIIFKELF